jgi:uncharacterized membrane protein
MHTLLDVLHVLTAVFLVGPMAILPMSAMRSVRAGDGAAVLSTARSTMIFSLASLLVVLFGFGVLGLTDEKYDLSVATPWVLVSIILYAIALALNVLAVVPALRSAGEHLQVPEGNALGGNDYRRIAITSGVVTLLLVAVVVLMVAKP